MKFTAAIVVLTAATVQACPGSPAWMHAKCEMEASFTDSCETVQTEMIARANGENSWSDPHNGGTYTFTSTTSTDIAGQRVTGDAKYTDKFDFHFEADGTGCKVSACSESQVNSLLDYSTNYCNLHSLYCSSDDGCPTAGTDLTYKESFNSCKQHDDVCVASSTSSVVETVEKALRGTDDCKPVQTQDGFDLNSYIEGRWYIQEQAVTSYLPAEQNFCVYAEYSLLKKSFWGWDVQVHNYAQEQDGTKHDSGDTICAHKADDNDAAKLEVAPCFLPTFAAGPYWVLEYDEATGSALVSGGQPTIDTGNGCKNGDGVNGSGLWIFTRQQKRDEDVVGAMRAKAEAQGFDLSVLNLVDQSNCE
ncbi:hypothetical protein TL16_g03325 [Triparma laevis f. inornata]|uniref:Uncharacterized protein n=1 Tax=Triparma laevis f. inornata TaxID=1714386 RepID=A0A9W6ZXR4_9STRA|nr:hypothetical protein TL16_g03325 [Triparma laevis f. inornata]